MSEYWNSDLFVLQFNTQIQEAIKEQQNENTQNNKE